MANYIQLTRVGETVPSTFVRIDAEMCRALGQPVDAVKWLAGWYDWLAMGLASGISPEKIRGWVKPGSLEMAIIEYIVTYYEVDAWYQAGR